MFQLYGLQQRIKGGWHFCYEDGLIVTVVGNRDSLGWLNTGCRADYRWVPITGEG